MFATIGDYKFEQKPAGVDGLGYAVRWESEVAAPALTNWGNGDGRLNERPLPVAFISNSTTAPTTPQQQAFLWLAAHWEEATARVQAACENAWKEYYWEGNEMDDDEEYHVEGIRIPPGETSEYVSRVRDSKLPALIVVDLQQDWELEHAFYVVLDPSDPSGDQWTTWDGLMLLGLLHESDDEDFEDDDDFDDTDEE